MKHSHPAVTKRLLDIMNIIVASDLEPDIHNQAAFAQALNIHPATISQWVSGVKQVTVEQLVTACTRFKVSGTYLLLGRGDIFLPGTKIQSSQEQINKRVGELTEKVDSLIATIHNQTHLKRAK